LPDVEALQQQASLLRLDLRAAKQEEQASSIIVDASQADLRRKLDLSLSVGMVSDYRSPFFRVLPDEYANDPAERLAILTTFIRDPSNPDLGFSIGHKSEAGIEFSTPHGDAALAVTVFQDKTTGGIGVLQTPAYLLRDHYALTDTTLGDGRPPTVVFPPEYTDTVPVLIDQPANILTLDSKGIEGTVSLPELRPLGLRLEVTGAWVKTSFF